VNSSLANWKTQGSMQMAGLGPVSWWWWESLLVEGTPMSFYVVFMYTPDDTTG
jgi:hypothetical protein